MGSTCRKISVSGGRAGSLNLVSQSLREFLFNCCKAFLCREAVQLHLKVDSVNDWPTEFPVVLLNVRFSTSTDIGSEVSARAGVHSGHKREAARKVQRA